MKSITFYLLLSLMIFNYCSLSQERSYKDVPSKYKKEYVKTPVPKEILDRAVNAADYLPKQYVKDGSVDYTAFFQKALDDNKVVLMPNGVFSTTGLKVRSNSTLVFDEGSELHIVPSSRERYEIIAITAAENVVIYNPKLKGDLRDRKSLKGEWGFGIDIRGSKNVKIYSPFIRDCLGDGIVVSKSYNGIKDKSVKLLNTGDILIDNAYIDYMGRNGIAIVGVDGLQILSPIITNVFLRSPKSAIDIEPDNPSYEINNILIESPFTFNNVDGIMINLRNFVSAKSKAANIVVNNHIDVESTYPINFPDLRANKAHKAISGKVVINNPVWINPKSSMVRGKTYSLSNKIEVNNPKLIGMKLKSWKGKNLEGLTPNEKLIIHIKDNENFTIK